MRGNFFVGMALGALAGIVLIESSSEAKKMVKKGKQMIQKQMSANSNDNGLQTSN